MLTSVDNDPEDIYAKSDNPSIPTCEKVALVWARMVFPVAGSSSTKSGDSVMLKVSRRYLKYALSTFACAVFGASNSQ